MASPIQFGDTVGLTHPGTNGRISPKSSNEFVVFSFTGNLLQTTSLHTNFNLILGGVGLIQNGNVVTLVPQVANQYTLLDSYPS